MIGLGSNKNSPDLSNDTNTNNNTNTNTNTNINTNTNVNTNTSSVPIQLPIPVQYQYNYQYRYQCEIVKFNQILCLTWSGLNAESSAMISNFASFKKANSNHNHNPTIHSDNGGCDDYEAI